MIGAHILSDIKGVLSFHHNPNKFVIGAGYGSYEQEAEIEEEQINIITYSVYVYLGSIYACLIWTKEI